MIYELRTDKLRILVSDLGAELQSVCAHDGTEYLWQGDAAFWKRRAINLFPYIGRLPRGSYYLDGRRYELPMHGFAPTSRFELAERSATDLLFVLRDSEETHRLYPRSFCFGVRYHLEADTLTVTYKVKNLDTRRMPCAFGGHPGFRVPLDRGLKFTDYRLVFSRPCKPERIGFSSSCLRNSHTEAFPLDGGSQLPLQHSLFDRDTVLLQGVTREVSLLSFVSAAHGLTLAFPDFPYLGIWHTPGREAPFICLEPWSSLPAAEGGPVVLEEQEDLWQLEPGEAKEASWILRCF